MPDQRLPDPTSATPEADPATSRRDRPGSGRRGSWRPLRAVAPAAVVGVLVTGWAFAPVASAQVDPPPDPTTTAAPTTAAPTTAAPTTAAPTTAAPVTNPPTTVATTRAPVVTTSPPTTYAQPAVVPSTASSVVTTSTSTPTTTSTTLRATTTTAGLLVDGTETVATEPVADTDGLGSTAKLRLVVVALVAIAVLVSILTFLYWRRTRPYEWAEWDEEEEDESYEDEPGAREPAGGPAPSRPPARDGLASGPVVPVVPSLIDPDLRARIEGPPGSAAPAGSLAETQAMPVIPPVGADGPASPATPPDDDASAGVDAAPARWGTARAQRDPVNIGDGGDPDAPFRPPND